MPRKPTKSTTKPKRAPRVATTPPAALDAVQSYRHAAKRKNIPPAGLASQGKLREAPKMQYAYNPHLPPVLRFDASGASDKLPDLLQTARARALNADEAKQLADALRVREPWLEWAGKREKKAFEVDPVALHIHERIAAQAILKIAARENIQRSLFADPELSYREAIQFYQHDVDWTNRMILGDSLQVMASLAHREGLAGKVQMMYIDPPYGIKFASNFQPEIGKRDVKDKEADLTREPEMVKAYRDTWTLGIHSYLAYLRDRLMLAKELLADSGSIFVQIGDENLHRVRAVMDEVFDASNFVAIIAFATTSSRGGNLLGTSCDFLLWYARDISQIRYRAVYETKTLADDVGNRWTRIELGNGERRPMSTAERRMDDAALEEAGKVYRHDNLTSQGSGESGHFPVRFNGTDYLPGKNNWKTNAAGMARLLKAERLGAPTQNSLAYIRFMRDFPMSPFSNVWIDTQTGAFTEEKKYVVQTNTKVIERCVLMTTDPGDLVLDPTCGSGTTAYVAEEWGRRWITIDTSRVALSLARQRLLTATFPFFKTKDGNGNPSQGFVYKTAPHIMLKSIAQNVALDAIFARHQPILDAKLAALNAALKTVTPELRQKLQTKLQQKEKREGKKSITDADRRRWLLPRPPVGDGGTTGGWAEWQVPFDTDDDWTSELKIALTEYRAAWRAKMDEVNAAIAANAEPTDFVDQPEEIRNIVRVSGPFTMEAVMPLEESLSVESPIAGAPEELETFGRGEVTSPLQEPSNAEAYLDKMLRLLRSDGVRFPNNKVLKFTRLEPFTNGDYLHALGEWESEDGKTHRVAVSFGPEFGPITAYQVENALRLAHRRGFDDLVLAGFSFDAEAQATIEEDVNPDVRCHLAHIRPDVNMGALLKETPNSQIFTVFGSPRTELRKTKDGEFVVEMQGVDIYNPVENTILPTSADKVAAWFLDSDYDGKTFCITQAFFPDKSAWDKLARALKGVVDEERFAAFSGTVSLPFPAGEHKRAAVKVIDPRGNEVMRVHRLDDSQGVKYAKR